MLTRNKSRNIERLLYLADEVAKTKPDKKCGGRPPFYFGSYADEDKWDGKNQKLTCGTTACAIGLASTLPKFRRLGLRLKLLTSNNLYWGTTTHIRPIILGGRNSENEINSWKDVADKLGLTEDEYMALFIPGSAPNYLKEEATPKDVANQIRSFCKAAKKNKEDEWLAQ